MGYLIKEGKEIEKIIVTVPQSDVANLSALPFTLIAQNTLNEKVLLSAHLSIIDPVGQIDSFGHFYLGYKPDTFPGSVYDENNGAINNVNHIYSFLINATHPPNRFGANNPYRDYPFQIISDTALNTNCDLIVTMYFLV
jgi:hypothetical protein